MLRIIRRLGPSLGLLITIAAWMPAVVSAQTWTGAGADNLWTNGVNWSSNPAAPVNNGTADIIYSSSQSVPRQTSTVNTNYDINTLTFQGGALAYTIDQTGGSTLTIEAGIVDSATTLQTISAPVTLGTLVSPNQTWSVDTGGTLRVTGKITGNGGTFTKAGGGVLQFGSAANTGFGPINITGGTLQATTSGAIPDVDYTISAGTLDMNGTTNTVNTIGLTGTGAVTTGGGTISVTGATTMANSSTFTVNGGTANLNGGLTQNDSSNFTANSSSNVNITGNHTLNNTSQFNVNGGAIANISGTMAMHNTATVNASGGTINVGTLTGDTGTTFNLGTNGTVNITNTATNADFNGNFISTSGGTVHVKGNKVLTLGGDNQTGFLGGSYIIDNGATLKAGAAKALSTANYQVDGTLDTNGNSVISTGLTGANTGNVSLGGGTLTIQNATDASYSGNVNGTAGSSIVTSSTNTANQTIAGVIGPGPVKIVANGGTLTLTGNNSFTGGTTLNNGGTVAIERDDATVRNLGATSSSLTFNGGTLQINGNTADTPTGFGTRTVVFQSGGTGLDIQQAPVNFTVDRNITGDHLNVNPNGGLGTVILTGNNTYNTTNITGGTLQVGDGGTTGTLGTGAVNDHGTLVINKSGNSTISNRISDSATTGNAGAMRITGGGTVTLTGTNSLQGDTTIDAGSTLKGGAANIPGNVVDNGTLDFTQATDATFSHTINGIGNVIKDGAGTLTLDQTNSYGATAIHGGRLDINGTTTSGGTGITVSAAETNSTTITGGTLGGTGTIIGDIVNNGTVSPGTTASPLAVLKQTGNYDSTGGGTLVINVNDDKSGAPTPGVTNSELQSTGTATLGTGKVHVNITGGNFSSGATYTAIEAANNTHDQATIDTSSIFVKAAFTNSNTDVQFTLTQDFVPTVGGVTFNQRQIGQYLNTNVGNTNNDFQDIISALTSITDPNAARDALTQLTGDIHPSMAQFNVNNTQIVINQVASRLRAAPFAPGGPLSVADDSQPSRSKTTPVAFVGCDDNGMPEFEGGQCCGSPWAVWGIGFGMGGSTKFDGNATSATYGMGGIVAGLERWEDDCHLVGVYGAYVGSSVTAEDNQSGTMNGGQLGAYLFGDDGFNYYTVLGGLEFDGNTTVRRLNFGEGTQAISDIADGRFDDWQTFIYAERGMSFESCHRVFQPFIGLQYIYLRQDSFQETGATNTALDLTGSADTVNSLRSLLGARMQWAMAGHTGRRTLPEIHAIWVHEYLDTTNSITQTMTPIGGTPFITQGLDVGRDWALLGGNFTWEMLNGWSMFVNYDMQTNALTTYHVGSGGLGYRW